MPFIHTRVNRPISKETEKTLAAAFGDAISLLPGKSEKWLMLQFEENCRLYFQGQDACPMAFVKVQVYGTSTAEAYDALTGRISSLLEQHLMIRPDHVYISYEETSHWGWNGNNF